MARITVEDCVDKVANRFELVLRAAHRARRIAKGSAATVDPSNDKNTVIALREIAEKVISASDMREGFIESLQENTEVDEPEPAAAPALPPAFQLPRLGRDDPSWDPQIDVMTEDALLRAMKSQTRKNQTQPEINLGRSQHVSPASLPQHKAAKGGERRSVSCIHLLKPPYLTQDGRFIPWPSTACRFRAESG